MGGYVPLNSYARALIEQRTQARIEAGLRATRSPSTRCVIPGHDRRQTAAEMLAYVQGLGGVRCFHGLEVSFYERGILHHGTVLVYHSVKMGFNVRDNVTARIHTLKPDQIGPALLLRIEMDGIYGPFPLQEG